tara:strand:- start:62 stop:466 length:405 start_codon:yes stop_codon:yes gene_type:complete
MKHNSDFKYDWVFGNTGENVVRDLLRGDKEQLKVEVKTDRRMHKTKNIFIEKVSRGKESGIETTEADYWAILTGDKRLVIHVETNLLKKVLKEHESDLTTGGDNDTSIGYRISVNQFMRTILHYIEKDGRVYSD